MIDDVNARLSLESTIQQLSDIWIWVDPSNGRVVECNASVRTLLFYEPSDLIGRSVTELADSHDLAAAAWQCLAGGRDCADSNIVVRTKFGAKLHMSAISAAMQWQSGEPSLGLTIWRDISSRRQAEFRLRETSRRLQMLAYEITVAEARERERIANGLHDEIGQVLAVLQFKLGALGQAMVSPESAKVLDEARELLTQAVQATRSSTFELHSPFLQHLGLQAAIEGLGQRLERMSQIRVHLEGDLGLRVVDEPVSAVVFRIVRELTLNAQKHSQARNVWISLGNDEASLTIRVRDDGVGFQVACLSKGFSPEGGFGLFSAEAQMQAIGGLLELESSPGKGTQVTLRLPLPNISQSRSTVAHTADVGAI